MTSARATFAILALFVIAAFVIEYRVPTPRPAPATSGPSTANRVGELPAPTEKQLDLVVETAKLFINWAFAVLGVNGFFLKGMADTKLRVARRTLLLTELSAGVAFLSLVYGQIVITNAVGLLQLNQFAPNSNLIAPYVSWQYRSLVIAAALTFANAHQFFWLAATTGVERR